MLPEIAGLPRSLIVATAEAPSDGAAPASLLSADLRLAGHRVTPDRVRFVTETMTSCIVFLPAICAEFSIALPVWELLATVLVTGSVTFLTIFWSLRAARAETTRAIAAAKETERREREERQAASDADERRRVRRERIALGESLFRAAHDLYAVRNEDPKSPRRLAARAAWTSLGIPFGATAVVDANRVYEYATILIDRGMNPPGPSDAEETFPEWLPRTEFLRPIEDAVLEWARDGALSSTNLKVIEEVEAAHMAANEQRKAQTLLWLDFLASIDEGRMDESE
ncbi:hypothetical protein [Microbacterium sp. 4-7]|uniref:hypothetical protein n=1 Tax=Microbacterium sp. 4-7 TaxID=1885327 RepID=UPI001650B82F|nr:hypothetical protein [Microbacterium sp. 4-7]